MRIAAVVVPDSRLGLGDCVPSDATAERNGRSCESHVGQLFLSATTCTGLSAWYDIVAASVNVIDWGCYIPDVLVQVRLSAEALLDVLRPARRLPQARPAVGDVSDRASRLRLRLRIAILLLRIMTKLRVPWSCKRTTFAACRTFAREGMRAPIVFGMREASPKERYSGPFAGHVWIS